MFPVINPFQMGSTVVYGQICTKYYHLKILSYKILHIFGRELQNTPDVYFMLS